MTTRVTPVKPVAPPIPTAVPTKLSPASAAIAPMANSRFVSTHSMASTVSSTPKKAVVVGTLGRKQKLLSQYILTWRKYAALLRVPWPQTNRMWILRLLLRLPSRL